MKGSAGQSSFATVAGALFLFLPFKIKMLISDRISFKTCLTIQSFYLAMLTLDYCPETMPY